MGTQTLGNPASGNSTQFWFEDTGSGVAVRPNDPINAPEELYIDKIHVFCGAESSNAASSRLAIYQGSGLVAQTANFTLTTGVKWQSASFAAGSFVHRNNGVSIRPEIGRASCRERV